MRYNYDNLCHYCEENGIELLEEYVNVNVTCEIRIKAKCLMIDCQNEVNKTFYCLVNKGGGCFCQQHTEENKKKKMKQAWKNTWKGIIYDYDNLCDYCEKNDIELLDEYRDVNVTRDTRIKAKCLMRDCRNEVDKSFYGLVKYGGCFCQQHTEENRQEKKKHAYKEKTGYENPAQDPTVQEKKKQTYKEKTGYENPFQDPAVQEKMKQTYKEKTGYENPLQDPTVQEKRKRAYKEKTGYEHPLQDPAVQENRKRAYKEKTGYEHPLQDPVVQEKMKQTYKEKTGYEHPSQDPTVQEKKKQAYKEKTGYEHPSQDPTVQEKMKQAYKEKTGYENPFQDPTVQEKKKQTNIQKYGVEYPMQNAEIADKSGCNAYKSYEYTFPSGRVEKIQGYERFMLDELLGQEQIPEEDIIVKRNQVPVCWYIDKKGARRRYYVDCFIPSQNRCIEVKSTWTLAKKDDSVWLKIAALKELGYSCDLWVYSPTGEKVTFPDKQAMCV
jgi:hypothetical protein